MSYLKTGLKNDFFMFLKQGLNVLLTGLFVVGVGIFTKLIVKCFMVGWLFWK